MVDGINISEKVAEKELLPDDLNSLAVGNYTVPVPIKRKIYPYLTLFVIFIFYIFSLYYEFINFNPVFIILGLITVILFLINNKFKILQSQVIESIIDKIDYPINYYSIALTFQFNIRNFLKPIWTVIVYSSENPPKKRTIIEIDAFNGEYIDTPHTEILNA